MVLFEQSRDDIKILITANISRSGDLQIKGIDTGPLVKKLKGDWDYEYALTVRKAQKQLLIRHLQDHQQTVKDDEDLLKWLKKRFSHNESYSAIMTYLKQANILFESFFWE